MYCTKFNGDTFTRTGRQGAYPGAPGGLSSHDSRVRTGRLGELLSTPCGTKPQIGDFAVNTKTYGTTSLALLGACLLALAVPQQAFAGKPDKGSSSGYATVTLDSRVGNAQSWPNDVHASDGVVVCVGSLRQADAGHTAVLLTSKIVKTFTKSSRCKSVKLLQRCMLCLKEGGHDLTALGCHVIATAIGRLADQTVSPKDAKTIGDLRRDPTTLGRVG
jgi:hypothetical protein